MVQIWDIGFYKLWFFPSKMLSEFKSKDRTWNHGNCMNRKSIPIDGTTDLLRNQKWRGLQKLWRSEASDALRRCNIVDQQLHSRCFLNQRYRSYLMSLTGVFCLQYDGPIGISAWLSLQCPSRFRVQDSYSESGDERLFTWKPFTKVFIHWAWWGRLNNGPCVIRPLADMKQWVLGLWLAHNNYHYYHWVMNSHETCLNCFLIANPMIFLNLSIYL